MERTLLTPPSQKSAPLLVGGESGVPWLPVGQATQARGARIRFDWQKGRGMAGQGKEGCWVRARTWEAEEGFSERLAFSVS